jgi:hypothetical protein
MANIDLSLLFSASKDNVLLCMIGVPPRSRIEKAKRFGYVRTCSEKLERSFDVCWSVVGLTHCEVFQAYGSFISRWDQDPIAESIWCECLAPILYKYLSPDGLLYSSQPLCLQRT